MQVRRHILGGSCDVISFEQHTTEPCRTVTYRISTIQQAVEVGVQLRNYWFRGHRRMYGALTPGIFRNAGDTDAEGERIRYIEANATMQFRRHAHAIGMSPSPSNDIAWLMTMQHHGLPTRLLDWTENVLVALYFAVRAGGADDIDGELWAMFPPALNSASMGGHALLPLPRHPALHYLAGQAMAADPAELNRRLREMGGSPPVGPVAFEPIMGGPRMMAQASVFTIHPNPFLQTEIARPGEAIAVGGRHRQPTITAMLVDSRHLVRYVIAKDCKPQLRQALGSLGLSERSLFLDLDGLARDIKEEINGAGSYGDAAPPEGDGLWQSTETSRGENPACERESP